MGEIRLYYKIDDISGEWSQFYYYNGCYNKRKSKLESYSKRINKSDYYDLLDSLGHENDKLLYYLNEIEYSRLLTSIDNIKTLFLLNLLPYSVDM